MSKTLGCAYFTHTTHIHIQDLKKNNNISSHNLVHISQWQRSQPAQHLVTLSLGALPFQTGVGDGLLDED